MHQGRSSVNPGMTLEEPNRHPDCNVLRLCLNQRNNKAGLLVEILSGSLVVP